MRASSSKQVAAPPRRPSGCVVALRPRRHAQEDERSDRVLLVAVPTRQASNSRPAAAR